MIFVVTDAAIDAVERRWSAGSAHSFTFDEERRVVLRHTGSCDVQACPGSGKTTTLTAKLLILLDQLPDDQQGICVLSHTNAARQEVIDKLGEEGQRLLRRPHFVGTIQSFVNQYLAVPEAITRFGIRPWAIDDAAFAAQVRKRYGSLPPGAQAFFARRAGTDLTMLRYRFSDLTQAVLYRDSEEHDLPCGPHTASYQAALAFKDRLTHLGCLAYHDAFALGHAYLKRHPTYVQLLARRFPFVFIDEMQDTDKFQMALLDQTFANHPWVQRFGDTNQSIFTSSAARAWTPTNNSLKISSTRRLSASIAQLSARMSAEPHVLTSLSAIPALPHTVLLFDKPQTVLPAFAALIAQHGPGWRRCMAVGAVGVLKDQSDRLSIPAYHPAFSKRIRATIYPTALQTSLDDARIQLNVLGTKGPAQAGPVREVLMNGLVQCLREQGATQPGGQRLHTPTSVKRTLRLHNSDHALDRLLLTWIQRLASSDHLKAADEEAAILAVLAPLVRQPWRSAALDFIRSVPELPEAPEPTVASNLFECTTETGIIRIGLDTIHAVKGQTHDATLLLETYNRKHDLTALLPWLTGRPPRKGPVDLDQQRLKLAYVAMTRPKALLCLAMRRSHITEQQQQELSSAGWTVQQLG